MAITKMATKMIVQHAQVTPVLPIPSEGVDQSIAKEETQTLAQTQTAASKIEMFFMKIP